MKRLFLVDGSSLVHRSYWALARGGRGSPSRPGGLRTSHGLPTGAVYGFLTSLRKILADHHPDHVGIAFDHRVPTFRHEAYAEYKSNRKPMEEDLVLQLPYVRRAVEALRIPVLVEPRYEADDLLGALARRAAEAGLDVVLVTSDKDMYQLLTPRVSMLQVRTETRMVRAADVPGEFGVRPDQVVDVLALWGDASDNIPGVRGIGEKGAKALISEWGSLDQVYAHLDRLKPALAAKLRAGEADARLSRDLATIRSDLDFPLDLEALRLGEPDREALHALASELEFRALAAELAPAPPPLESRAYPCLAEPAAIRAFLATAEGLLAIELDLEPPAAPGTGRPAVRGIALATAPERAAYVPISTPDLPLPASLALESALACLAPALADPAITKVSSDLKRLVLVLAGHARSLAGGGEDTMLLSYLLDPGRAAHDLDTVAQEILGRRSTALPEAAARAPGRLPLDPVPTAARAAAFGDRAQIALRLVDALLPALAGRGLLRLYREVELPLLRVLAGMETRGVRIDTAYLGLMSRELEAKLAELVRRSHEAAGIEFNLNSPRQLGEILFGKMQIPVKKKTRKEKAASTDTEVLEELARTHELPRLVLEHRELTKLKGTYIDALPALVDPRTGRVHTSYNQAVAATGRLSSSDPNLQNIPIRTEVGRRIRRAFVAAPGSLLVAADYSQIELRLLAHLSGDAELTRAFREGSDVHATTAATMFGTAPGLVTSEQRRRAKVINFGIIYGMSDYGLAKELGIRPAEAGRLKQDYFRLYAGVRAWLDRTIAGARADGKVTTLLGRIRYIPEIASPNRSVREYAERTAVNTPIQGTAADLIKVAMLRIAARLEAERLRSFLTMQVHDELVLEAPEAEAGSVAALVREEMEGAEKLSVPLVVTVGVGPSWLDAK